MNDENRAILESGLRRYGIEPAPDLVAALSAHLRMVVEWNERINLTAITEEREMVLKHVLDSVSALELVTLEAGVSVLDVGTGAGFPGVVLKCVRPDVRMVLLESLNKRCTFLQAVGQDVISPRQGSEGFEVVWGRAEDIGRDSKYREQFDLVVARAVAELRILAEYCLPFCKVGGHFLAMKGPSAINEISAAERALATLGGTIAESREIHLPEEAGTRTLILIKKVKGTPKGYPRKAGTPSKTPL